MSVLEEQVAANMLELIPSAYSTTDPMCYVSNASEEEKKEYRRKLAEHTDEWCGLQAEAPSPCTKTVRSDVTCDFFLEGIESMFNHAVNRVRNLLLEREIFVRTQ